MAAACGWPWPRRRPSLACRSPRAALRVACQRRRDRLRGGRSLREETPARRDGPRPRLRRPVPHRQADHPPRRNELFCHRQYRSDPVPRGPADRRPTTGRDDRSRWPILPPNTGHCRRSGFTHLQPAQPTTVGKRACLWAYDLVLDLAEVEHRLATLRFRSTQGTTGTQASFLSLFDGDHAKVEATGTPCRRKDGF